MRISLYLVIIVVAMSGCALLKKNRVLKNQELEKEEFGFNTFYYPSIKPNSKTLVVFFSGDGGWLDFDAQMSQQLALNGFETVGINSRSYFWESKTPKTISKALAELIRNYHRKTKITRVYLMGYSFGADITPFAYAQLPFFTQMRVKKLVLLSPFATTDFTVHLSDLLGNSDDSYPYDVKKEVSKIKIPIDCFYGEEENKALEQLKMKNFNLEIVKGGHRYEAQEYQKIIDAILSQGDRKNED